MEYELRVNAGMHSRVHCPMRVKLEVPKDLRVSELNVTLIDDKGEVVPCQSMLFKGRLEVSWIIEQLNKNDVVKYRVLIGKGEEYAGGKFEVIEKNDY